VRRVATVLEVSRSHLHERLRNSSIARTRYRKSDDAELLITAFADAKNETVVMVNRDSSARKVSVAGKWVEMERTGLTEENAVSAAAGDVVMGPGEILVLSTFAAER